MKHIKTDRWCYGSTDEYFTDDFPTKDDAIKYAKESYGGYIGRMVKLEFDEKDICYDETGYYLQEQLYDEVGDVAENWSLSTEQELELCEILAKAVIEYINKNHLQANCYSVTDIEEITVDEVDMRGEEE